VNPDELYPLGPRRRRLHITAAERALYVNEWARYCELYPDVEAPEPTEIATRGAAERV
jgi:hypothetical protein